MNTNMNIELSAFKINDLQKGKLNQFAKNNEHGSNTFEKFMQEEKVKSHKHNKVESSENGMNHSHNDEIQKCDHSKIAHGLEEKDLETSNNSENVHKKDESDNKVKNEKSSSKEVTNDDLGEVLQFLSSLLNSNENNINKDLTDGEMDLIKALAGDVQKLINALDNGSKNLKNILNENININGKSVESFMLDLSKKISNILDDSKLKEKLNLDTAKVFSNILNKVNESLDKGSITLSLEETNLIKDALEKANNTVAMKNSSTGTQNNNINIIQNIIRNDLHTNDEDNSNKENKDNAKFNLENDSKPKDLKIKTSEEQKINTLNDDKVLSKILDDNNNATDKLSMFQKRMDALNNVVEAKSTPIVQKQTMPQDIIKNVKFMVNNSIKELTVKIYPKELGEISIRLTQEDGLMKATLKANTKDTYTLLSQNAHEMKKLLGDQNIKISNVEISLYNEDTTFYKEEGFNNGTFNGQGQENSKSRSENHNVKSIDEEEIENEILNDDGSINMLA